MAIPEIQNLESLLRRIQALGVDVEIYFDEETNITGRVSYVGSDFVELDLRIPGSDRKAICPFHSIRYLAASYETPK